MASENPSTENPSKTSRSFWYVVLGVAVGATLLAVFLKKAGLSPSAGLGAGESAPPLQAVGWLNGEAPAAAPPQGSIRVLHAWKTNCVPCYREAAELVELHKKFHDRGVEFVGITYEPPQRLADVRKFLDDTGITWVNGYGGVQTFQEWGVEAVPCVWIVDSEGHILWNLNSPEPLEEAIPLALAGKLTPKHVSRSRGFSNSKGFAARTGRYDMSLRFPVP